MAAFTKLCYILAIFTLSFAKNSTRTYPEEIAFMRSDYRHILDTLLVELPDKQEGLIEKEIDKILEPVEKIIDAADEEIISIFDAIENFFKENIGMLFFGTSVAVLCTCGAIIFLCIRHNRDMNRAAKEKQNSF